MAYLTKSSPAMLIKNIQKTGRILKMFMHFRSSILQSVLHRICSDPTLDHNKCMDESKIGQEFLNNLWGLGAEQEQESIPGLLTSLKIRAQTMKRNSKDFFRQGVSYFGKFQFLPVTNVYYSQHESYARCINISHCREYIFLANLLCMYPQKNCFDKFTLTAPLLHEVGPISTLPSATIGKHYLHTNTGKIQNEGGRIF